MSTANIQQSNNKDTTNTLGNIFDEALVEAKSKKAKSIKDKVDGIEAKKIALIKEHARTLYEVINQGLSIEKTTKLFFANMLETNKLPKTYISNSIKPSVNGTEQDTKMSATLMANTLRECGYTLPKRK